MPLDLFVGHAVGLLLARVLEVPFVLDKLLITSASALAIPDIVLSQIDAMLSHILISLVHPASFAFEVLFVTVH